MPIKSGLRVRRDAPPAILTQELGEIDIVPRQHALAEPALPTRAQARFRAEVPHRFAQRLALGTVLVRSAQIQPPVGVAQHVLARDFQGLALRGRKRE